jgi:AbrB family looped-hinge helix DNA binding protein
MFNVRRGTMQSRARLTSKGQITVPVAFRKRLGVVAGDSLVFETSGDKIIVSPQKRGSVFTEFRGMGTPGVGRGKKAVLDWVRDVRGDL